MFDIDALDDVDPFEIDRELAHLFKHDRLGVEDGKMTRQDEYDHYAKPENQVVAGEARRRRSKLTELVPVRFDPETLERIRSAADDDDRSVSAWIRRAVEHELDQQQPNAS